MFRLQSGCRHCMRPCVQILIPYDPDFFRCYRDLFWFWTPVHRSVGSYETWGFDSSLRGVAMLLGRWSHQANPTKSLFPTTVPCGMHQTGHKESQLAKHGKAKKVNILIKHKNKLPQLPQYDGGWIQINHINHKKNRSDISRSIQSIQSILGTFMSVCDSTLATAVGFFRVLSPTRC